MSKRIDNNSRTQKESVYRGATYYQTTGRWRAWFTNKLGDVVNLSAPPNRTYGSDVEAALAYDEAKVKEFGILFSYKRMNFTDRFEDQYVAAVDARFRAAQAKLKSHDLPSDQEILDALEFDESVRETAAIYGVCPERLRAKQSELMETRSEEASKRHAQRKVRASP